MSERFLFWLLIFFVAIGAFYLSGNFSLEEIISKDTLDRTRVESELKRLTLEARALSAYNLSKNYEIFSLEAEKPRPSASLVKSMTVTLALNILGENRNILLSAPAVVQSGDFGLRVGERWKASELAKLTLLASANDGAYALYENTGLALAEFLSKMNEKAKKIGMEHTLFQNVTGLDRLEENIPVEPSGLASAQDLNILAYYVLRSHPEVAGATVLPEINLKSESGFEHNFENTNIITEEIPNLLFSKTGFTDIAGGNLTVIFKNEEGDLIAVTLLGSSYEGRFTDMEQIVNVLYNS